MRAPELRDLPPPPANRRDWPWAESSATSPDHKLDRDALPKISVVTPSFNQSHFLEETIQSVLEQTYPNLEYIVIDGGSTDGSVEIIKRYEKWLHYWVSEPDRGQSHAINKGFSRSTGDLLAWLNSDDLYVEGALHRISEEYKEYPNHIIAGSVLSFNDDSRESTVMKPRNITFENVVKFWEEEFVCYQPGVFFPRQSFEKVGALNEAYHYVMDYDLWCRLLQHCPVHYTDHMIAKFRLHGASKTGWISPLLLKEQSRYSKSYWHLLNDINRHDHDKYMAEAFIRLIKRRLIQRHYFEAINLLFAAFQVCPRTFLQKLMNR
jgi:glycosyltransferase involved in cell wall biosynthesis